MPPSSGLGQRQSRQWRSGHHRWQWRRQSSVSRADPAKQTEAPTATDGILQFPELDISPDLIVLSTPEIAGLPYTVAALVAAGGLAAALSTADGLLVVIASAIAHDVFFRTLRPNASAETRMRLGKAMILVAAGAAALAAVPRLALIAQMVAWAFSLAAASFFPIVLLGIFWKRANGPGAIAGMIGGLAVTIFYMVMNYINPEFNVLGISHLSAGIFGVPVNFILIYVVSMLTPEPSQKLNTWLIPYATLKRTTSCWSNCSESRCLLRPRRPSKAEVRAIERISRLRDSLLKFGVAVQ